MRDDVSKTACAFCSQCTRGLQSIDVTRQESHYLAERHVRIARAGMRIALPRDHHQVRVGCLGAAREGADQRRLSASCFADHERDSALPCHRLLEKPLERCQFLLACDEQRHRFLWR